MNWSIQGWSIGDRTTTAGEDVRPTRAGRFARLDVVIPLRRGAGYFVWKLGVPLAVIVLMGYTVYYLPPTSAKQQIGVGMTSVLTLVAYMLALGSALPRIEYLTMADKVFIGCALLVFLGLVKTIATEVWVSRGDEDPVRTVDRLGRVLYPVAMVVVVVAAFLS